MSDKTKKSKQQWKQAPISFDDLLSIIDYEEELQDKYKNERIAISLNSIMPSHTKTTTGYFYLIEETPAGSNYVLLASSQEEFDKLSAAKTNNAKIEEQNLNQRIKNEVLELTQKKHGIAAKEFIEYILEIDKESADSTLVTDDVLNNKTAMVEQAIKSSPILQLINKCYGTENAIFFANKYIFPSNDLYEAGFFAEHGLPWDAQQEFADEQAQYTFPGQSLASEHLVDSPTIAEIPNSTLLISKPVDNSLPQPNINLTCKTEGENLVLDIEFPPVSPNYSKGVFSVGTLPILFISGYPILPELKEFLLKNGINLKLDENQCVILARGIIPIAKVQIFFEQAKQKILRKNSEKLVSVKPIITDLLEEAIHHTLSQYPFYTIFSLQFLANNHHHGHSNESRRNWIEQTKNSLFASLIKRNDLYEEACLYFIYHNCAYTPLSPSLFQTIMQLIQQILNAPVITNEVTTAAPSFEPQDIIDSDFAENDQAEKEVQELIQADPISPRTELFFKYHMMKLETTASSRRLIKDNGATLITLKGIEDFKKKRKILAGLKELTQNFTSNWQNSVGPGKEGFNTFWLEITPAQVEPIAKILADHSIPYKIKKILLLRDSCVLVENSEEVQNRFAAMQTHKKLVIPMTV